MQQTVEATEALAHRLESTGDYRILRRLVPRPPTGAPLACGSKTGIIVDFETTGLDTERDEILEVAMVKFSYSRDGRVLGVIGSFQAFQQPSTSVSAEITKLTGITDAMVEGHAIDADAIEAFVAEANIVTAHSAKFDRKFAERYWNFFQHKHWACSATEIAWKEYGFGGAKLEYLLAKSGLFHDAHRALDDCQATLEILARALPGTSVTALSILLECARRKSFRIWATGAPFALKDALKRRGYRWNDGTDGRPRSWYIDVAEDTLEIEQKFLATEIYTREIELDCREVTALDRFSNRV
jgi:DNA polymerase-3 subunit epsilon